MNIWRLITHHDEGEDALQWSRREGVIALGHGGTGDLRERDFANASELTHLVADSHNISASNHTNGGRSLWRLYSEMQKGDLVILSTGGARRGLTMRVAGEYYYAKEDYPPDDYWHRRKAEAIPIDPNRLWQVAGGVAIGENVRRSLIRCARAMSEAEVNALIM